MRLVLAICLCIIGGATCFVAVSHLLDSYEDAVIAAADGSGRLQDFAEPALADAVAVQLARARSRLAAIDDGRGRGRPAAAGEGLPGGAVVPPIVRRLPALPEEPKVIAAAGAVAEAASQVAEHPPLPVQNSRRQQRLPSRAIARRPSLDSATRSALGGPLPRR